MSYCNSRIKRAIADRAFELHHAGTVPNGGRDLLCWHRQANRFLAVAIQHGRHFAVAAQAFGIALTARFALFDL